MGYGKEKSREVERAEGKVQAVRRGIEGHHSKPWRNMQIFGAATKTLASVATSKRKI